MVSLQSLFKLPKPTKGKVISQENYDKIMDEKSKEMLERFKTRKGNGEHLEISIGG